MINQQTLIDTWTDVKESLQARWNQLTDDDLQALHENVDKLISQIQRKTGETREAVEYYLSEAVEAARSRAAALRDQAGETAARAGEALRHGYAEAEATVKERPAQSMAVAFGLGMIAGVGLSLLLRERPRESFLARSRHTTEQLGKQVLDALSKALDR